MIIFFIFIFQIGIDPIDHVEILTVERIHPNVYCVRVGDIVCGRNGAEDIVCDFMITMWIFSDDDLLHFHFSNWN